MKNRLAEIDRVWRSAHPDSYALLKDPMSQAEFDQLSSLMKVTLPDEYRAIFEWKGGQSALAERGLLPEWRLMQYEEIRIEYKSMLELYEMGEFSESDWWRPEWLPLLTNAEGTTICYDSLGSPDGRPGQLIQFSSDSTDRTIWFPGMDALLASAIAGFETPGEVQFPEGYPIARRAARPAR
jgi:cell wall assembly regulator SMI1